MSFVSDTINNITGKTGSRAAKDAAQQQQQGADQAIAFQRESRDMARADLQPFKQAGEARLNRLADYADNNQFGDSYMRLKDQENKSIGYENALTGLYNIHNQNYDDVSGFKDASNVMSRQVMNNQAARGKLGSGSTLMDLFKENALLGENLKNNEYNRGLAFANFNEQGKSNNFQRAFDTENVLESARRNNFQQNYSLANMGQASAAGQAAAAQNTGIADLYTQRANAGAAGAVGAANASIGGTNNLINLAGMAYGMSGGGGGSGLQPFDTSKYASMYR
jgi:hypothetical protein